MPDKDIQNLKLLEALKNGDSKAFEAVFRKFNAKVYGFVMATLFDKDLAEDITQSVFLSVWEHRTNIDPGRNFQGYIFTIARNMVYRHTENIIRNRRFEEYIRKSLSEKSSATEEHIDAALLEDMIMRMIEKLPEARRRIFLMSFRDQMSNREIAEELSLSTKTVETQIRRSTEFLKKNMHSIIGAIALTYTCLP